MSTIKDLGAAVITRYYVEASGRTIDGITSTKDGEEFLNEMIARFSKLEEAYKRPLSGYATQEYNGLKYHGAKYVYQIQTTQLTVDGIPEYHTQIEKRKEWREWLKDKNGNINYDKLSKTAVRADEFEQMHWADKLLLSEGFMLVKGNQKADYNDHKMIYGQLKNLNLYKTWNPSIVIPFDGMSLLIESILPETEGSLEKIIGGRWKSLTSPIIGWFNEGEFDNTEWIVDDNLGETIILSWIPKMKSGEEIKSGKLAGAHIKGMFLCKPDNGPKVVRIGKNAIKGKYYKYGFHLAEAHIGKGRWADYKDNDVRISLDSWSLFWMLKHPTINKQLKEKIGLCSRVFAGTASLKEVKSLFTRDKENLSLEMITRALAVIEIAEFFESRGIIKDSNAWINQLDVQKAAFRVCDKWLRSLALNVPAVSGKIYTADLPGMEDGCVYVTRKTDMDTLLRYPTEFPIKVKVYPFEMDIISGCVPLIMTTNTAALVGGDGDGDQAYLVSSSLFTHALDAQTAKVMRERAKNNYKQVLNNFGPKLLEEKLKIKALPGISIKDGVFVQKMKDMSNWSMHEYYKNLGSQSIGVADKAIQDILYSLGDSVYKAKEYIWSLFFVKQDRVEAQKNHSNMILKLEKGEIEWVEQSKGSKLPALKIVSHEEVKLMANELYARYELVKPEPINHEDCSMLNEFEYWNNYSHKWLSRLINHISSITEYNPALYNLLKPILDVEDLASSKDFNAQYKALKAHLDNSLLSIIFRVETSLDTAAMAKDLTMALNSEIRSLRLKYQLKENDAVILFVKDRNLNTHELMQCALATLIGGTSNSDRAWNYAVRSATFVRVLKDVELLAK